MNQYKDIIQMCSCDPCRRAGLSLSEEAGNWASRPDCEGKSSITPLLSQSGLATTFSGDLESKRCAQAARDRKACYQLTGSVWLSAALRNAKTSPKQLQLAFRRSQLAAGAVQKGLLTTVELKLPTRWRTKNTKTI